MKNKVYGIYAHLIVLCDGTVLARSKKEAKEKYIKHLRKLSLGVEFEIQVTDIFIDQNLYEEEEVAITSSGLRSYI